MREINDAQELIKQASTRFGGEVIATTSFGATSGVLIHLISELDLPVRIVHVNTGFLFQETLDYVDTLKARYRGVEFVELKPALSRETFLRKYGADVHAVKPDLCCKINKIDPLNNYLMENNIRAWITAVRKDQTEFRKRLEQVKILEDGMYKVMPLLNWNSSMIYHYMADNNIPLHPSFEKGYTSIGCRPCTSLPSGNDERSGRWKGMAKTECGLHVEIGNR